MPRHRSLQNEQVHMPFSYVYADATEKDAATGFTEDDIGKLAWQQDDDNIFILKDASPTWQDILYSTSTDAIEAINNDVDHGSTAQHDYFSGDHADLSNVLEDQHHNKTHADNHTSSSADEVDGDKLDIDWNPANYSPDAGITEADSVDNLSAHLKGIDTVLAVSPSTHASRHKTGGADVIDGDELYITFAPSSYTRDSSIAQASGQNSLAAHLKGLDTLVGTHKSRHSEGGLDELDVSDLSGGNGTTNQVPKSDGEAVAWGNVAHSELTGVGTDDHHTKYTDAEAIAAIDGDASHGADASHNYYTDSDAQSAAVNNSITDGNTTTAPSEDAVHDALAGKAATDRKLDDFGTPDDNTDLDASTTAHGLMPKLPDDATKRIDGTGAWVAEIDYEEGTWTPELWIGGIEGTGVSYKNRAGYYIVIGNQVTVFCRLRMNSVGTSTGNVEIHGLPFASSSKSNYASGVSFGYVYDIVGIEFITGQCGFNLDYIGLYQTGGSGNYVTDSEIGDGFQVQFSLTYEKE